MLDRADCADFGCHNSIRLEAKHFLKTLALTFISFSGRFVFAMQKHYLFFFCERSSSLFGVLRHFPDCTGHITTGSWKGRGNQYIQFIRVLYCKLPTSGKQLPAFPLEAMPGTEPWPQRWEARVLPLCHHGPITLPCEHLLRKYKAQTGCYF